MTTYLITINSSKARDDAMRAVINAPFGSRVEVKAAKRSLPQNDRMWAMLTEVALQVKWPDGKTGIERALRPNDWKLIFLAGLHRELETVANLEQDGGLVSLRLSSSSDLTKSEMSDMIELIYKFGAEHGVVFARDDAA